MSIRTIFGTARSVVPTLYRTNPSMGKRCLSTEASQGSGGASTSSTGSTGSASNSFSGLKESGNRVGIISATVGVVGALGFAFDTVYRRVSKEELEETKRELKADIFRLDVKIDTINTKIDTTTAALHTKIDTTTAALSAKIDNLTAALLHVEQRNRISAEDENRMLRRELEKYRGSPIPPT